MTSLQHTHKKKIRAVALDIDGTITDKERKLSTAAITAIRKLEAHKIPVMLASGNVLCVAQTVALYVGASGPVIAENGGVVSYHSNTKVLDNREYCDAAFHYAADKLSERGIAMKKTLTDTYRLTEVAVEPDFDVNELKTLLKNWNVTVTSTGYAHHISRRHINKFKGVVIGCEMLAIDPKNVLAIGDAENDAPMLKGCGISATVANRHAVLAEYTNYVSKKAYGDGVVDALRHFLPEILR